MERAFGSVPDGRKRRRHRVGQATVAQNAGQRIGQERRARAVAVRP